MTRKRNHRRRPIEPAAPRGLRPKLAVDQVQNLSAVHWINLDLVAKGQASEDELWETVHSVLTWSRVAELLDTGVPEMTEQLDVITAVIERYGRTGRVGFSGAEYQLAKRGIDVMDALASITDKATAVAATEWAEMRVNAQRAVWVVDAANVAHKRAL